jgi:hypothetical protein
VELIEKTVESIEQHRKLLKREEAADPPGEQPLD